VDKASPASPKVRGAHCSGAHYCVPLATVTSVMLMLLSIVHHVCLCALSHVLHASWSGAARGCRQDAALAARGEAQRLRSDRGQVVHTSTSILWKSFSIAYYTPAMVACLLRAAVVKTSTGILATCRQVVAHEACSQRMHMRSHWHTHRVLAAHPLPRITVQLGLSARLHVCLLSYLRTAAPTAVNDMPAVQRCGTRTPAAVCPSWCCWRTRQS
jgi:hypothetical protein